MSVRRIAQLAELSPSAVSLALHDSPKVSEATKRRVLKLAKRLGYRKNAKVAELMSHVRLSHKSERGVCFGVISLYEEERPWEKSLHLTRIYDGMTARADALGYRLEPLWLRAPGMTYRRCRAILDARGIKGLLCFGSRQFDDEFPIELDHYAIVAQGLSIKTPLHRVVSHVYNDMWRVLNRVHELGYRRPGLVIGRYEEMRSAHAYICVYAGWSQLKPDSSAAIPVLQLERIEEAPLLGWYERHRPDVIIFANHYDTLTEFTTILHQRKIRVPQDVGVAVISQLIEATDFSGLQENQHLIGAWSVELLVSRLMNRDLGIPSHPRIEMVERRWIEGKSLRRQPG